jgi:transcriptional regulator with XRE-family HTH domain
MTTPILSVSKIRNLRLRRGMSQEALAERTGLTNVTISHIETGRTPRPSTVVKIAEALGVSPEDLWESDGG